MFASCENATLKSVFDDFFLGLCNPKNDLQCHFQVEQHELLSFALVFFNIS